MDFFMGLASGSLSLTCLIAALSCVIGFIREEDILIRMIPLAVGILLFGVGMMFTGRTLQIFGLIEG